MEEHKNISRRDVLKWSVPFLAAAAVPGVLQLTSCKSSTKKEDNTNNQQVRKPKKTPVQRGNPYANRDEMFLHNKTNTLHYPYVFKTYDQLKEQHFTSVNPKEWENQLDKGAHFAREKSALIFERLALRNLKGEVNNDAINKSASIIGRSFTTDYAKQNIHNWRGYHLLLQLIAINTTVADADKWATFSNAIKEANVSQIKKIPKRHSWIVSQQLFDQRVQYIHQHNDEYLNRIKKRVA